MPPENQLSKLDQYNSWWNPERKAILQTIYEGAGSPLINLDKRTLYHILMEPEKGWGRAHYRGVTGKRSGSVHIPGWSNPNERLTTEEEQSLMKDYENIGEPELFEQDYPTEKRMKNWSYKVDGENTYTNRTKLYDKSRRVMGDLTAELAHGVQYQDLLPQERRYQNRKAAKDWVKYGDNEYSGPKELVEGPSYDQEREYIPGVYGVHGTLENEAHSYIQPALDWLIENPEYYSKGKTMMDLLESDYSDNVNNPYPEFDTLDIGDHMREEIEKRMMESFQVDAMEGLLEKSILDSIISPDSSSVN